LDSENHREKRSLAGLMTCIFNAAANTEKMSRTGESRKELSDELSRDRRKQGSPKAFATRRIDDPPMSKHPVSQVARASHRSTA